MPLPQVEQTRMVLTILIRLSKGLVEGGGKRVTGNDDHSEMPKSEYDQRQGQGERGRRRRDCRVWGYLGCLVLVG